MTAGRNAIFLRLKKLFNIADEMIEGKHNFTTQKDSEEIASPANQCRCLKIYITFHECIYMCSYVYMRGLAVYM